MLNAARPTVRLLLIYPVKALDPLMAGEARINPGGALENDRRWAMCNKGGTFVNGKKNERVSLVRSRYRMHPFSVFLKGEGSMNTNRNTILFIVGLALATTFALLLCQP